VGLADQIARHHPHCDFIAACLPHAEPGSLAYLFIARGVK
jgi:hypothetical protein